MDFVVDGLDEYEFSGSNDEIFYTK